MKTQRTFVAVVVLISMFVAATPALAIPPLPSSLYGTVTVNGANVGIGLTISAWINGAQIASTKTLLYGSTSVYAINVPGDDPTTPAIEGGVEGDTIVFHIDTLTADQTATWHSGTNTSLNLTASVSAPTIITSVTALNPFVSTPGVPSAEQTYTVSGYSLAANITVTPPPDFEISTTSGAGFTTVLTLVQTAGTVPATTIYARFNRGTVGTSSGNITHASAGAVTKNVAVSGTASINYAPVLSAIGDKSATELSALAFAATASDTDAWNVLTYSLLTAPSGAAIDPSTGAFTWTPTEAQGPGSYPFTVKVCDNGSPSLCDEELITVTVSEVNYAPVLAAIGPKSIAELTLLSFTAAATDSDLPANTLTWSLSSAPSGALINASTGAFTWTPTEAQGPGSYPFTVKVCDNAAIPLCDSELITVTVNEVNVAPTAVADSYTTDVNTAKTVAAPGVLANDTDVDVPANTLTAVKVTNPAHGTLTLNANGSFTYTPAADWSGTDSFTYKTSDGTVQSATAATVTIVVSAGPTNIYLPMVAR